MDNLKIGNKELESRLFIGTGKFPNGDIISKIIEKSNTQVVTTAIRRVNVDIKQDSIINHIPKDVILLPNTSGARTAEEAIRIARLGKAMGCGNWVKIEVIPDCKYLLPDNEETIKATKQLVNEGFVVLPYMNPDLISARKLVEAGAAAIMPLGAPIGSNRGFKTEEIVKIIIEEIDIPVIVDAGIGKPSDAVHAMEIGAAGILVDTAVATSENPIKMAEAFSLAVKAGRLAYEAKLGVESQFAKASSPLTGFLNGGDK